MRLSDYPNGPHSGAPRSLNHSSMYRRKMRPMTRATKMVKRPQSLRKKPKRSHGDDVGIEGHLEDAAEEEEVEVVEEEIKGVEKSQQGTKAGEWARMKTQATTNLQSPPQTTPQLTSSTPLSTSILHTLEELWAAILKTHIISPSGPRKADNDIYTATEGYMTLRMGPKESLSSFKERFTFALRRVAIIGGAPEAQGIATTRFIKSLDPARFGDFWKDLDTSVTLGGRQPPRTLEEAFQLAYDSMIKVNSSFKYSSSVNESQVLVTNTNANTNAQPNVKDKNHNKGYKGSTSTNNPLRKKFDNKKGSGKYNNKGNDKDHNKQNQNHSSKQNKKSERREDVTCFFCGKVGHFQSDCRTYKKAQESAKGRGGGSNDDGRGRDRGRAPEYVPMPPTAIKRPTNHVSRSDQRQPTNVTSFSTWGDGGHADSSDDEPNAATVFMIARNEEKNHGYIILDGASGAHIIKDRELLTNIRPAPKPLSISGITEGPALIVDEIGDLPFFGACYFDERARANVLCQTKVEDEFRVHYQQGKHFMVQVNPMVQIEFRRKGTKYICPSKIFLELSTGQKNSKEEDCRPTEVEVNHADVSEEKPTSGTESRQELHTQSLRPHTKSVMEVLKWQRNLGFPALSSMKKYVAKGYILNLPITPRQIEEAILATNGRTTEEMKGKAHPKHQTLPTTIKQQVEPKSITLNIDIMFLKSNVFLITISEPIYYTTSSHLRNRTWTELGRELMRVISGYAAKGHKVVRLRSDNEGCVVASQHILGLQGIDVELSDPESYIFIVESKIRWIKEGLNYTIFKSI